MSDTWVIARRGLLHMRRQPEALADATIQPVMFVLLFAFVFGGAIDVPGEGSYKEFLMGGIFAQTIVFGAFGVALALSQRPHQRRDRPLPLAADPARERAVRPRRDEPAPLAAADPAHVGDGLRRRLAYPHRGVPTSLVGYGLMIVFSFAMIWIGVLLGSIVATPEGVQGVAFVAIFPVTFIASTFVADDHPAHGVCGRSPSGTPRRRWRTPYANCSATPAASRRRAASWPLLHPTAYTLLWTAAIVAICAPIAVRAYRRAVRS